MNRREIVYAKKVMRTMHPLEGLPIEVILPILDPVIGVTRRCLIRAGYATEWNSAQRRKED